MMNYPYNDCCPHCGRCAHCGRGPQSQFYGTLGGLQSGQNAQAGLFNQGVGQQGASQYQQNVGAQLAGSCQHK